MEGRSDNVGALLVYVYPLSVIATITETVPELNQNSHFLISLSLSVSLCLSLSLSVSLCLSMCLA